MNPIRHCEEQVKRATRQSFKLIRLLRFARNDEMGFSILEVILASALLLILGSGAVIVVIQGLNSNRQGAEFTVANQFASEGIEAVKSIKDQAYGNLTAVNANPRGATRSASNVWSFKGDNTSDLLFHNSSDNFIRAIKVEPVNRDAVPPVGNIVPAPTGTSDPDTKKITSTVTWNFNSARAETLSLISYLSDWRKPLNNNFGVLVYGESTSAAQPKYRIYSDSSNSFNSQAAAGTSYTDTVGKNLKIKTSPTKQEAIAGFVNASGQLRILCFNGTNWSSEWTVNVGGNPLQEQRFDIAYETATGDVLVVYSKNVGSTNEIGYRTRPGSNGCGSGWSGETQYTTIRTGGIVTWIRLEGSPLISSNNIGVAWTGLGGGISAMIWTGSSFSIGEFAGGEASVDRISSSTDSPAFDIAFESLSGSFMMVWGAPTGASACTTGVNCLMYLRYTNAWSSITPIPTVAASGTNIDISPNPNTNEMAVGAIDDGPNASNKNNLSIAYWSGSVWTGWATVDNSAEAPVAGTKLVSTGWLINGATTKYVVLYNDAGNTKISLYYGTGSAPYVRQPDFTPTPVFAKPQKWYDVQMDPKQKDRLMFMVSDNNSALWAKKLVMDPSGNFTWTNLETGGVALESGLGQATAGPFGFGYWRNP